MQNSPLYWLPQDKNPNQVALQGARVTGSCQTYAILYQHLYF